MSGRGRPRLGIGELGAKSKPVKLPPGAGRGRRAFALRTGQTVASVEQHGQCRRRCG